MLSTQFYTEFYTFSRKSVKQENKFKLLLCSTTGFNDKVQIQLLTLPFCFSSHNIIWEKLDIFDETKQPCPSSPYGRPLVNTAIWYFSEQQKRKGNTHYCIFTYSYWNSYSSICFSTDLKSKYSGRMIEMVEKAVPFPNKVNTLTTQKAPGKPN